MDNNKKFELNDEALDEVAGGAVTDADYAACPFPHDSIIRNTIGAYCGRCYGDSTTGGYGTKCHTAKIQYTYNNPPRVFLTCTRCGWGFYSPLEKSFLYPDSSFLKDWELD